MHRRIRLPLTLSLIAALLPATVWGYGYYGDPYGEPGGRGYMPYPRSPAAYHRHTGAHFQTGMSEDGYYVKVYLEGISPEEVQVFVRRNTLVVQSAQSDEYGTRDRGAFRVARSHTSFRKRLRLPYDADPSRMETTSENGILEIYIPRRDHARLPYPMPRR
jgi:hypothetical protein